MQGWRGGDFSASETPADRNLTSIVSVIGRTRCLDDRDHELTDRGQHLVEKLGIDLAALRASRRVFARSCVDWADRRVHLAGALPAAITIVFLDRGWLTRAPGRRLRVTDGFDDRIDRWLAPCRLAQGH